MMTLGMIGLTELWPLLLIALLLFGGTKLPQLARAAGSSITQFKKGLKDEDLALDEAAKEGADKETP